MVYGRHSRKESRPPSSRGKPAFLCRHGTINTQQTNLGRKTFLEVHEEIIHLLEKQDLRIWGIREKE